MGVDADQQDVLGELDEVEEDIGARPAKVKVHHLVLDEQLVMGAVVAAPIIR